MNRRFIPILVLASSLFTQPAVAQEDETDAVANDAQAVTDGELYVDSAKENSMYAVSSINEVVIQENRLSGEFSKQNRNIRIIDQNLIKTLPVKSVSEVLSYVSGIDVRQRGPWGVQTDIGIDGGTFDQTLVLINGIKISDPQTGHNTMNLPVTLDAIERIEVLRGPAARIYGVNALMGAINIVTKKVKQTGVTANVYTGSNFQKDDSTGKTYWGYGFQATANLHTEQSQHLLSVGRDQATGFRYNTGFATNKIFYQGNVNTSENSSLQISGGFNHNDFGANSFYAAPADKESNETVQTALAAVGMTIAVNKHWTMKPRFSYRYNHDDYIFIRQKPEVYRNRHETHVLDAELNNTFTTDIGTFGLGLEWRNERINSSNLGKNERSNLGFYGEYKFDRIKDVEVTAGAYANYNTVYGWRVFPGIDAGWAFYKDFRLYANAGTAQRLPTYTDLYYKGPSNVGNDQLTPEYSSFIEGGLKYNTKTLNAQASYFYRHGTDFIDWVKSDSTQPWQPKNFQTLNTNGFTFAVDYRISDRNIDKPKAALMAGISYTYLAPKIGTSNDGSSDNNISNYAINSLQHQLCANVNATFWSMVNITLAARYQQRLNTENTKEHKRNAYTLFDTRVSFTRNRYSIYADITNLFDIKYIETGVVPMPGRWATIGFRWAWWK